MQKWEYKLLKGKIGAACFGSGDRSSVKNYTEDFQKQLNELGEKGWEAIGFSAGELNPHVMDSEAAAVILLRRLKK